MHIQVINFNLKGIGEADYGKLCDELAPAWAGIPGLVSKVWLANPSTNTYGGIYTWRDRQAMEDWTKTDLFKGVAANPNFANITSKDFAVMQGPTRATRGLVEARV